MFKVKFSSIVDVFDFVELYGSLKPIMRNTDSQSRGIIHDADKLTCEGVGSVVHGIDAFYCDSRGNITVDVEIRTLANEFDFNNLDVVTYGNHIKGGAKRQSLPEYMKEGEHGEKIDADVLIKIMGNNKLIARANRLRGKVLA